MITHSVYGGLGNQLFQIFTVISLSLKTEDDFFFLYTNKTGGHDTIRSTYWDTLFYKLSSKCIPKTMKPHNASYVKINEQGHTYQDLLLDRNSDKTTVYELIGYFQSYKYFDANFETICNIIAMKDHKERIMEIWNTLSNSSIIDISMHFRRGDYKNHQYFHPILPCEYYYKCLEQALGKHTNDESITVMIFCEEEDKNEIQKDTIVYLMESFPKCNFVYAPNTFADWEQMILMSLSNQVIIANSTFSWWGAMFNTNPNKVVYYPYYWFTEMANLDVCDMFPSTWIRVVY
jgi:hypothetical protein